MFSRSIASAFIWVTYLGFMYGAMLDGNLGKWIILLAFVLMLPLVVIMGMMWGMFNNNDSSEQATLAETELEKRKRDRIDSVLRGLSDDDLHRLRQRLSDGTIDDDKLYNMIVGDDGELISHN